MPFDTLDDAIEALPSEQLKEARVDVSRWFGEGAEFVYAEPSIAAIFVAQQDAEKIRARNPEWPPLMCQTLALMAISHVQPVSTKPRGELYAQMTEKRKDLALHLMTAFGAAFPHLQDLDKAADEAKNG